MAGLSAPAAAGAQTGGTVPTLAPKLQGLECRFSCTGVDSVRPGGTVRVLGSSLATVKLVVFLGKKGTRDDISATARAVRSDRLEVTVPAKANSGPVAVVNSAGQGSGLAGPEISIFRGAAVRDFRSIDGSVDAQLASDTVLFAGREPATLRYMVLGSAKPVRVDLVSGQTNEVVQSWPSSVVEPGVTQIVTWSGMAAGKPAKEGKYQFRIYTGAAAAKAAQARPSVADSFSFLQHIFPIRAKHDYGTGFGAAFGADRGGRSHQGHDVFAACGAPLVAARGGTVQKTGFHGAAGIYAVIDGAGTGMDYVYMHLQETPLVEEGQRVYTGQPIGLVGDTGNARGCHLHFELWGAPGYYEGGSPFDPLAALKSWDRSS